MLEITITCLHLATPGEILKDAAARTPPPTDSVRLWVGAWALGILMCHQG